MINIPAHLPSALITSLRLALLMIVPGAALHAVRKVHRPAAADAGEPPSLFQESVLVGLFGAVTLLLSALALAAAGLLNLAALTILAALISAAALIFVRARLSPMTLKAAGIALIFIGAVSAAVMLIPKPGEWIVGGWDPGVYINQGVSIARNHGFRAPPLPCYRELSARGLELFTRGTARYTEAFPGCPIDPHSRRFVLYFFPLTPVAVALLHIIGGLSAAIRINWIFGALAVPVFAAALRRMRFSPMAAGLAALTMTLQPVFLFHLHEPVSEMLQLFLLAGLLLLFASPSDTPAAAAAAFLLAAVANRISFFLFGSILVVLLAILPGRQPGRRPRTPLYYAALLAGLLLNAGLAPATFMRRTQECLAVCAAGILVLTAGALLALPAVRTRLLPRNENRAHGLLMVLGLLALAAAAAFQQGFGPFFHQMPKIISHVGDYIGRAPALLGVAGTLAVIILPGIFPPRTRTLLLFILLAAAVGIVRPSIAHLYPWATRRQLVYLIPTVAAGNGALFDLATRSRIRLLQLVALAAVLLSCAVIFPAAHRALRSTEFEGLTGTMSAIAEHIGTNDVLVADHPKWGTPLTFIYGRQVLNGRHIWRTRDPRLRAAAVHELSALARRGHAILLLTPHPETAGVSPFVEDAELLWTAPPVRFHQVKHHPKARDWKMRRIRKTFRLYRLRVSDK